LTAQSSALTTQIENTPTIDPSEIDTIVVPAREEGFPEVFLGENRWYAVRIHPSMIPKIHNLAVLSGSSGVGDNGSSLEVILF
jgi:hypothetical protein